MTISSTTEVVLNVIGSQTASRQRRFRYMFEEQLKDFLY